MSAITTYRVIRDKKRQKANSKTVATDWSLVSGKIPHLNDPRIDNKIYRFTLNAVLDTRYTTSTTVPVLQGDAFSLNTFPSYSTKTALFDQYRCVSLEAWIIPTILTAGSMWHSAVDYDNMSTPGSLNAVVSYSNCHSTTMQNGHYHKWVPHSATAAYKGAFTGYQNEARKWIDSAYPDVTLFGLKVAFEATSNAATPVNVMLRGVFEFRNPFS